MLIRIFFPYIFLLIEITAVIAAKIIEIKFERALCQSITGHIIRYIPDKNSKYGKYVISYMDDNDVTHTMTTKFSHPDPGDIRFSNTEHLARVNGKVYAIDDYLRIETLLNSIVRVSSCVFVGLVCVSAFMMIMF